MNSRELVRRKVQIETDTQDFEGILDRITDGFVALDKTWRITYWNRQSEKVTGRKSLDVIGSHVWDIIPDSVDNLVHRKLREAAKSQATLAFETFLPSLDRWYSFHIYPSRSGLSVFMHEVTTSKKAELEMARIKYYDPLTGLPNQKQFREVLTYSLNRAQKNSHSCALFILDLDRFRLVNDSFGYDQGNLMLVEISKRLSSCLRDQDTVFRHEGDNFAVILSNVTRQQVKRIADRILRKFQKPFVVEDSEVFITPSIGISIYPTDAVEIEAVISHADTAMYRAKSIGNNYLFYTEGMSMRKQLSLETELRKALERNELTVHYQPQFNIRTGNLVGMEALVRWQHPERGLISPGDFIQLAEDTGLIVPLGKWVLHTACAQNKAWQDAGYRPLVVSVNLSAGQFAERDLPDVVRRVLEDTGLDPCYLDLEITESMTMDVRNTIDTLKKLKALGVSICLDDFGTGYSSLSYLKEFPIDTLKIDQSFVRDCTIDANDATIVKTIIAMAHNLNLRVIAEGVEKKAHLSLLRKLRCNEAQGFLFSKPLTAEQLEQEFLDSSALQKA